MLVKLIKRPYLGMEGFDMNTVLDVIRVEDDYYVLAEDLIAGGSNRSSLEGGGNFVNNYWLVNDYEFKEQN
jgi:hypothetical protein